MFTFSPSNLARPRVIFLPRAGASLTVALAVMAAAAITFGRVPVAHAGATATVTMTDEPARFVPEDLKVKVGTTVEWKNTGATLHSVTADASKAQVPAHVSLPKGAKEFDSGFMPPGATFSQTFTVPGEYKYICIPHEKNGMIGEVEVTK
jgi:plastocyanin